MSLDPPLVFPCRVRLSSIGVMLAPAKHALRAGIATRAHPDKRSVFVLWDGLRCEQAWDRLYLESA